MRRFLCGIASAALAACTASPQRITAGETEATGPAFYDAGGQRRFSAQGSASVPLIGPIELDVEGGLPLGRIEPGALLVSNVSGGVADDPLQYRASYSVMPGDILATGDPAVAVPGRVPPTRLGGQHISQNIRMTSPNLAGSAFILDLTSESRQSWLIAGYSQSRREMADLRWSPAGVNLNLQWTSHEATVDPMLRVKPRKPLDCGLRGSVGVPTAHESGHSQKLRLSARDCDVVTPGDRHAELEAHMWEAAYVWSNLQRESEILLTMIDPAWNRMDSQDIEPAYEFAWSHRRSYAAWTADALIGVRQATVWENPGLIDPVGHAFGDPDAYVRTKAALTWHLPAVSLSAHCASGANPVWFVPGAGRRADRVGVAIDLSRWAARLMPRVTSRVGLNWNWFHAWSPTDTLAANTALRLNVSLAW